MDPSTQENQHEFFPDFVKPAERKAEPRVPGAGRTHKPILFTTTIEQILFTSIIAILVLCGVYFLGILRGKSLAGEAEIARAAAPAVRAPAPAARPAVQARTAARPAPVTRAQPSAIPVQAPILSPQARSAAVSSALAAATTAPAAAGARLYTIQVVTHKKRSFAENELAAIGKAGFNGRILESDGYYVVCVGQYAAKNDARRDLGLLKAKYSDCFLRRL